MFIWRTLVAWLEALTNISAQSHRLTSLILRWPEAFIGITPS
jgi:hypothetical protein